MHDLVQMGRVNPPRQRIPIIFPDEPMRPVHDRFVETDFVEWNLKAMLVVRAFQFLEQNR